MNPNEVFWLASYAHRIITPLAEVQDGYLILHLHLDANEDPGVDVWVHHKDRAKPGMIGHQIKLTTKAAVDRFAAKLRMPELQPLNQP